MSHNFWALSTVRLGPRVTYAHPRALPERVHLDSPAVDVMIDFTVMQAPTVRPHVTLHEALEKMQSVQVHGGPEGHRVHLYTLLVTNDAEEIIGLITDTDIRGEKPVEIAHDMGVPHAKITVDMVMTKLADTPALAIETVRDTRVGHLIETLRQAAREFLLVVEVDAQSKVPQVRGLCSGKQICRLLWKHMNEDLLPLYCHTFVALAHELSDAPAFGDPVHPRRSGHHR
jgi:CBS domain-containing protein